MAQNAKSPAEDPSVNFGRSSIAARIEPEICPKSEPLRLLLFRLRLVRSSARPLVRSSARKVCVRLSAAGCSSLAKHNHNGSGAALCSSLAPLGAASKQPAGVTIMGHRDDYSRQ